VIKKLLLSGFLLLPLYNSFGKIFFRCGIHLAVQVYIGNIIEEGRSIHFRIMLIDVDSIRIGIHAELLQAEVGIGRTEIVVDLGSLRLKLLSALL
jgi:sRNA-binding carbon storage regulator CsrA